MVSKKTSSNSSNTKLITPNSNDVGNNATPLSSAKDQSYTPFLPNGNGFFVLYYGDGKDESNLQMFEKIRQTNPNFVVVGHFDKEKLGGSLDSDEAAHVRCVLNGGTAKDCVKVTSATKNQTNIRTIYYVPMRCNDDPTLICVQKGLKPEDPLPPEYIEEQIDGVLDLDYDGIFFDETSEPQNNSDNDLYKRFANHVRLKDKNKLVIVNPGVSEEKVCGMFNYADIVSVENQWTDLPKCSGMNIPSWRWLSIQGDPGKKPKEYEKPPKPNDTKEAINRITTFRSKGGFWYYTAGWENGKPHLWMLADNNILKALEIEAKKKSVN